MATHERVPVGVAAADGRAPTRAGARKACAVVAAASSTRSEARIAYPVVSDTLAVI